MDFLCQAVSERLTETMPQQNNKRPRVLSITIRDISNEEEEKNEIMKLLFLPLTVPSEKEKEKEKKKEKKPERLPREKRLRMNPYMPTPLSVTALLFRLNAMHCLFTEFVPVVKPKCFSEELWQKVHSQQKIALVDGPTGTIYGGITSEVKVKLNMAFDTLIHFYCNYGLNDKYPFLRKSIFRWWSSIETPAFSPIKNFAYVSDNVVIRTFSFPTVLLSHPRLKDSKTEWFTIMAKYIAFLLNSLVTDPEKLHLLQRGGIGRSRVKLTDVMTVGELDHRITNLTAEFVATLDQ